MTYSLTHIKRGPSYWKFNDSLLHDPVFVNKMNTFFDEYKEQNEKLEDTIKWDLCKIKVKEFCISYSKDKAQQQSNRAQHLTKELNTLDKQLATDTQNDDLQTERTKIMQELELTHLQEAKSAQTRS